MRTRDRHDVFQNYTVMHDRRDELVDHLRGEGIEVLVSWPVPFHQQKGVGLDHWQLPETERLSARVLSLPMNAELEEDEVRLVAEKVRTFLG